MKNIEREIERTIGVLEQAEQQLAYWQERVDMFRKRLVLQQQIRDMVKPS